MSNPKPSYFAAMCEHMAATLSLLPSTIAPQFDRATILTEAFLASHDSRAQQVILNPEADAPSPYDLSRAVRYATVADMHADDDPRRNVGYSAFSMHTATKRDLRGRRVPFLSPYPHLATSIALLEPYKRNTEWARSFASYHAREGVWMRWAPSLRPYYDEFLHKRIALMLSAQFSARYDWKVLIGIDDGPRIALQTQPEHARKLFKARDLPPGKQRRAAIRHWVTEHFRRLESPNPTGVRSHFRGAETFDWSGLHCEVEPSEYDRDRVGQKPTPPAAS